MLQQVDRLLAIGDIHGCLDKLERLLIRVAPDENDLVVFLGDYIDRGQDSPGVVDFLIEFAKSVPSVFLLGNHEQMLLKYLDKGYDTFLVNGGAETLRQYEASKNCGIPGSHVAFFRNLRPSFETDEFIFVHAGMRPGIPVAEQLEDDLLWIRDEFLASNYNWGKTVVFGHTPVPEPWFRDDRIALDTGAVFSPDDGFGCLTCCEVQSRHYWQVA